LKGYIEEEIIWRPIYGKKDGAQGQ
jgi:hypothetical protein